MELHFKNKDTRELKGEVFKPYPLNPQYLASNLGRIKSKQQIVKHNHGGKAIKKEKILTQTDSGSGYLSVGLTENGKTKTTRVSRIIAITFVENKENKPQVNHINGVKYDNRSINLEWNTCGENVRHAWNNNLSKKQSSFLYIQERLRIVNYYTTYGVAVKTPIGIGKIIIDQSCYRLEYENGKFENLVKSLRFWGDDFKLILRNISDLTKEIEHEGKTIQAYREVNKILNDGTYSSGWNEIEFNEYGNLLIRFGDHCPVYSLNMEAIPVINFLLSCHFDLFGLIEKGLAVDINTLK